MNEKKERLLKKIPWWGRSKVTAFSHTHEIIRTPQDIWCNARAFDL